MLDNERLSEGAIVNVLLELETEGDEDIWTQPLKLSEDNWIDPEQEVLEVLVVTEVVSIAPEKVTAMVVLTETGVSPSEGDVEETVGAVVSVVVVAVAEYSS